MIDEMVERLNQASELEKTYIFFSTDKGYSIGQHRRQLGKQCAFEEDITMPLLVRTRGRDGKPRPRWNCHPLTPYKLGALATVLATRARQCRIVGHHPVGREIRLHALPKSKTYKALRMVGDGHDLLYPVWYSNEHELYDMIADPWQMDDIYSDRARGFSIAAPATEFSGPERTNGLVPDSNIDTRILSLTTHLNALLLVLETCRKNAYRFP